MALSTVLTLQCKVPKSIVLNHETGITAHITQTQSQYIQRATNTSYSRLDIILSTNYIHHNSISNLLLYNSPANMATMAAPAGTPKELPAPSKLVAVALGADSDSDPVPVALAMALVALAAS
jgi:hypothetical protein